MKNYTIKKNFFGGFLDSVTITRPQRGNGYYSTYTETIEILNRDRDTIVYYNRDEKTRRASLQLAPWAKRLHGNAPRGTYYGRFIIQLSDGTRVSVPVYVGDDI